MKGLIVLACTLAVAASSPTLGFLVGNGKGGHCGGGGHGGGIGGVPIGGGHIGGIGGGPLGGGHIGGIGGGPLGGGHIGGIGGAVGDIERAKLGIIANVAGKFIPGGVGLADRGYKGRGGVYPVYAGGFGQGWGFFVRGITDVAGNAGNILRDLLQLKIPGAVDDLLNGGISVARGLGGIINAFLPGLGTLLGNLVVSIGKIFICVLGSPGISGAVLGDRRPGYDNPVDIPYICRGDWGKNYGWNYDGAYKTDNIINYYQVRDAKRRALELVNRYTNGRGPEGLNLQQRSVFESILKIAALFDRDSSSWTQKDIDTVNVQVVIVLGILGNSYQSGLGPILVREWLRNWRHSKGPKRGATDLTRYQDEIFRGIQDAKEDKWSGAFDLNKRGDWNQIQKASQEDNYDDQSNSNSSGQQDQSSQNTSDSSDDSSTTNNKKRESSSSDSSDDSSTTNNKKRQSSSSDSSDDSSTTNNKKRQSSSSDSSDDSSTTNNKKRQSSSSDSSDDSSTTNNKKRQSSSSDSSDDSSTTNNKKRQSSSSDSSDDSSTTNNKKRESSSSDSSDDSSTTNNKKRQSSSSDSSDDSSTTNNKKRESSSSDSSDDSSTTNNKKRQSSSSDSSDDSSTTNNKKRESSSSDSSDDSNASTSKNKKGSNSDSSDESNASNNNKDGNGNSSTGGSGSNDSDSETSADGSYKRLDLSSKTARANEEKNRSSSSSGSGKKIVNADGSREEEYNFQNSNAESIKKSSVNTDAQEHRVEKTSDDF